MAADSSKIRRELGYREQVPFDEALRRTIEWERAQRESSEA
jgi:nucleoside-diphosphate-sugar epimerase